MITQVSEDIVKVKLIDFNVSRRFRTKNKYRESEDSPLFKRLLMMSQTGAPAYSAPELISGDSYKYKYILTYFSEKVDLWGLGCILYLCIFGRVPFNQTDHDSLVNSIRNCDYS